MPITRTPMIDDDGSGQTGTVVNNTWKSELYDQIDGAIGPAPAWQPIPFNAGHYSTPTAGATWVVTAANYSYIAIGKLVTVSLLINGTSAATGAPVRFYVLLPFPAVNQGAVPFSYFVGGHGTGVCLLAGTVLDLLQNFAGSPFPAGVVSVAVQISYARA